MYLEITTTHAPATDLGFLARKNPAGIHETELSFGKAVVFYPRADADACTLSMLLQVDPIGLVRGGQDGGIMDHYVNDRPYAASSFMSVAIARSLREAMAGKSRERQELADTAIPLDVVVGPVPARGGPALAERLFAPLGYAFCAEAHPFDAARPDWGTSPYLTLRLKGTLRLADLLSHLYVLLPVLDRRKHYFVGDDEIEKLLARGGEWLQAHPERDLIVDRYLHRSRALVKEALGRLDDVEGAPASEPEPAEAKADAEQAAPGLHDRRLDLVAETLARLGARKVLDLGCGEGKLAHRLARDPGVLSVTAVDVGPFELMRAAKRLDRLPTAQREKVTFLQGSLLYRDARLRGHDAAALVEVIEHVEPSRLVPVERSLFGYLAPRAVVVTTPNREYNALFPNLPAGKLRHPDHRFEFTRAEFSAWTGRVAAEFGYAVEILPVGEEHPEHGAVTQMAVFTKGVAA